MQLHSTKTQNEDSMSQDYGNDPFIYAANLNLDELIEWLKTELATLSHRHEFRNLQKRSINLKTKKLGCSYFVRLSMH